MAELIRITTCWVPKEVYRSSVTGKFVSKRYYLDNPDTTYKSSVNMPKYEWFDPNLVLDRFLWILFYDSGGNAGGWPPLLAPIDDQKLRIVCDRIGVSFEWVIKVLVQAPTWMYSVRIDIRQFKMENTMTEDER